MPPIDAALMALLQVLDMVLSFYIWLLVIGAILSWLLAFEVINRHNRFVEIVTSFTFRMTEPVLRPIRRLLPPFGGIDLSPMILIFAIIFLQSFIHNIRL